MTFIHGVQNTQGINVSGVGQQEKEKQANGDFALFLREENAHQSSVSDQIQQTSRETIAAHNALILQEVNVPDPKQEFMEFASKSSEEKMREQILLSMGLTEEDLEAMSPEDRMKIEMKIAEVIQEKVRQELEKQMASAEIHDAASGVMDAAATEKAGKDVLG